MKATKTCVAAQRFQYDYLNDDLTDDGQIDYSLTNKVPASLQKAIKDGKKILVLINPPYAEAANSAGSEGKTDVAKTRIADFMGDYGYASRELFTQFVVRISKEIPNATVAMFSTLKYFNAGNFEKFREKWRAKYLGGFIVHSRIFDGLTGSFPIGFLVWNTGIKVELTELSVGVLDKNTQEIGEKYFYNLPKNGHLNAWLPRLKTDSINIPLKNAIHPQEAKVKVSSWIDNAIGYMYCNSNDLQHAGQQTVLFSSVYNGGNGFYVTSENVWQVAVIFSVRLLVKHTWVNHNDQFLQPTELLSDEFKNDCLIWMLFNGKNCAAGANDLEWNDKKWSLVNHFIPYTETEVGAPDRFESDFMVQYLAGLPALVGRKSVAPSDMSATSPSRRITANNASSDLRASPFSSEAQTVLDAGRTLWQAYFAHTDVRTVRDELKLNRPDVGWYQIRNALKARNASGDTAPVDFTAFSNAYQALSDKLQPQVFELGFLR